jgi:hypothetical protein
MFFDKKKKGLQEENESFYDSIKHIALSGNFHKEEATQCFPFLLYPAQAG